MAEVDSTSTVSSGVANFLAIKDIDGLALYLGLPAKKLTYLLYVLPDVSKYTIFTIPKKSGDLRTISAPNVAVKRLQRILADILVEMYAAKDGVHGYVKDRSIISNGKAHLRKRYLLSLDVKDFFPSINFGRVRGLFLGHPFNFPAVVATAIARLSCNSNELPSGAPTSPIISNFICWGLDTHLRKLSFRLGCTYTRYADDISISTNRENFPSALATITHDPYSAIISDEIVSVLNKSGFSLNSDKTRLATSRQSQVVTGLKVNEFLNVDRSFVRQVRAMLNAWEKFGLEAAEAEYRLKFQKKSRAPFLPEVSFKEVVHGKLMFLRSVRGPDDQIYQRLLGRYAVAANLKHLTSYGFPKQINHALWLLSSDKFEDDFYQGTAFHLHGVGIITCAHVLKSDTKARRIYNPAESLDIKILHKDDEKDYAIIEIVDGKEEVFLVPDYDWNHQVSNPVRTVGFPAHEPHATVAFEDGAIIQVRTNAAGNIWYRVNNNIVGGSSGGPVLNEKLQVVGIIASGATSLSSKDQPVNNGYIPISCVLGK
jgi:RNA-directed DNA polymerase